MQENARALADLMETHGAVSHVYYPGLASFSQHALAKRTLIDWRGEFAPGHMLSFVLKGRTADVQERRGHALMNWLAESSRVYIIAVSLGYIGTLIEDPNRGTHATISREERKAKGIEPGLIRISTGIEDTDDLLRDLLLALDKAAKA